MSYEKIVEWLEKKMGEIDEYLKDTNVMRDRVEAEGMRRAYQAVLAKLREEAPRDATPVLKDARVHGDTLHVDLWYPRTEHNVSNMVIGLSDTRAADGIRVSYDFDRDGWEIEQASVFDWEPDNPVMDEDWQEVAFVQAWGRTWDCSKCGKYVVSERENVCPICGAERENQ